MRSVLMYGLTLAIAFFINPIPASADGNTATVPTLTDSAANSMDPEPLVPSTPALDSSSNTAESDAALQVAQEQTEDDSSNGTSKFNAMRLPLNIIKTILMNVL